MACGARGGADRDRSNLPSLGLSHDGDVIGQGCDSQFEFEFGLDLILDGMESARNRLPGE